MELPSTSSITSNQVPLKLLKAAKEGQRREEWNKIRNIILARFHGINDLMKQDTENLNFTILHHACNKDHRESASIGVHSIFGALKSFTNISVDDMFDFVNQRDAKERTALHIVLEKNYHDTNLVLLLLKNGADVNTKAFSDIQAKYPRLVLNFFDRGLTLRKDKGDLENEELWTVECNFREIGGYESKLDEENDTYRESEQLATILDLPKTTQTIILSHPLVECFLIAKRKRFQILIWFSIFCHIIWSILSATYITCNITSFSINDSNNENGDMTNSENWITCNNPLLSCILVIGLTMLIKEITELIFSRSKRFYWNQGENWGQWGVLFTVFFVAFFNLFGLMDSVRPTGIFTLICLVGLGSSLILIQAQFTKIETLGIYHQLMIKGFWKILKLLLVFLPMLTAYLVIFRLLMPNNSSFNISWGLGIGKILAGMQGELNYDELFDDKKDEKMFNEYALKAVLIFFVISIVILFQNMLIALSMNNIEILEAKATVAHLATTLEIIYLMEAFLMHDNVLRVFEFLKIKAKVVQHLAVNDPKIDKFASKNANLTPKNERPHDSGTKNTNGSQILYNKTDISFKEKESESATLIDIEQQTEEKLKTKEQESVPSLDTKQHTTKEAKTKHEPFIEKFVGLPRKLQVLITEKVNLGRVKVIEL